MLVRATQVGFYNNVRHFPLDHTNKRRGEVFALSSPKHYSWRWMEIVEATDEERANLPPKPKSEKAEQPPPPLPTVAAVAGATKKPARPSKSRKVI